MDGLLHRGKYAVEPESEIATPLPQRFSLRQIIGIDEGFSQGDRWIAYGIFWWSVLWFLVVFAGTIIEFIRPFPDETWALYWQWAAIRLPVFVFGLTCIWFAVGGTRDLFAFFRHMHRKRIDVQDDGTVETVPNQNG